MTILHIWLCDIVSIFIGQVAKTILEWLCKQAKTFAYFRLQQLWLSQIGCKSLHRFRTLSALNITVTSCRNPRSCVAGTQHMNNRLLLTKLSKLAESKHIDIDIATDEGQLCWVGRPAYLCGKICALHPSTFSETWYHRCGFAQCEPATWAWTNHVYMYISCTHSLVPQESQPASSTSRGGVLKLQRQL